MMEEGIPMWFCGFVLGFTLFYFLSQINIALTSVLDRTVSSSLRAAILNLWFSALSCE